MHTNGAVVAGCSARVHGGCEIFTETLRLEGWVLGTVGLDAPLIISLADFALNGINSAIFAAMRSGCFRARKLGKEALSSYGSDLSHTLWLNDLITI